MGSPKTSHNLLIFTHIRLAEFVRVPLYEAIYPYMTEETVVNDFLRISCHDSLYRSEVLRINNGRSKLHRDIWSIDVTSVKERLTLVTDDDRPSW
jgi:hypothetical protein